MLLGMDTLKLWSRILVNLIGDDSKGKRIDEMRSEIEYEKLPHTASGAWQVASIAYTASKLSSGNGMFIKSACIIKYDNHVIVSYNLKSPFHYQIIQYKPPIFFHHKEKKIQCNTKIKFNSITETG